MNDLEQLRTRSVKWTLADDSKLITVISSLVESMIDRGRNFDSSILTTSSAISRLHSTIDTAESAIGLYSGTQFIEQRVLDDDYRPRRPSQPAPTLSLEQRQAIILDDIRMAMKNGLQMIDNSFRRLGDDSDPFIQYEPIDRYNKSIPPLIGSDAFHSMGKRMKKKEETKEIGPIAVSTREEVSSLPSSSVQPSPSVPSTQFIGISAYPPSTSAPPPPPPPMPTKISPLPIDRSALNAKITSALKGARGEFRVPHDDGPEDVDAGLPPPLPPRSTLHPTPSTTTAPNLPPRGSLQHTTAPELPPKKDEKPSTTLPLPAEPKKKSIFDFDSDDDDFATVLSRPSKTQASSSTLSSSMRSNESETKSEESQEEKKEQKKNQASSSLVAELAAAAANKRAQQLESAGNPTVPQRPPRSFVNKEDRPIDSPGSFINPLATSTPAPKKEEKKKEEIRKEEEVKPVVKKQSWAAPKKSIFDDEDSDLDDFFKPPAKNSTLKKEEIKEEVKKEEVKKTVQTPKPVAATPQPPKPRRKNIFDSDSDEDFLKPKTPVSQRKAEEKPKKEEPPPAVESTEPLEHSVSNRTKAKEEDRKEEKEEEKGEKKSAEKTPILAPPEVVDTPKPSAEINTNPIASDSIEKKDEGGKGEESLLEDSVFIRDPFKTVEEQYKEQPHPPREEKAFTPLRESPPPIGESPIVQSKSSSEESVKEASNPLQEKPIAPARVKKELSVHFDSPPPFDQPEEEPTDERDHRDSSPSDDSDTEAMQGNRAAFMAQLNAKLAAKPPSGEWPMADPSSLRFMKMGVRPVSMIETSSTPFVPPSVDRSNDTPPITRRAANETKSEGPLSHANKSRPRGPVRRPPTTKRITSSSESEDTTKSVAMPRSTVSPSAGGDTVSNSIPPKSPVPSSPVKESPVVFRKTSDPKSPPSSISRKSSSSFLGPDGDPLSAISAVHTSPYKTSPAAKPPTNPMSRRTVSSISTVKSDAAPTTHYTDSKPKKSIFDSDSDDFYEKFGGSKTLPTKNSAFKKELESALKKDKKAPSTSSSQKKGLFDDSDEDLDMFRKKK